MMRPFARTKLRTAGGANHVSLQRLSATVLIALALTCRLAGAAETTGAAQFHKEVQPLLEKYCFDCHADGANKGGVSFDEFKSDKAILENRELWGNALKYLRAGMMPPDRKPQPTKDQKDRIEQWIKSAVFEIDPKNPDPGRVT